MKEIVVSVRSSYVLNRTFREFVSAYKYPNLQLLNSNETRWNSTFLMIVRAVKLIKAVDSFTRSREAAAKSVPILKDEEWSRLKAVMRSVYDWNH